MMESIGTYLRRQREIRKIPLEDVSQITKINLKSLQALEADDLHTIPGHVFAKGFVKSYARSIGLDVDEALLQLEEHLKETAEQNHKIPFLSQKNLKLKSWMVFAFFLTIVIVSAYLSSR